MNIIFSKVTVQFLSLIFLAGVQKVEGTYPKRPREVNEPTEPECSRGINLEFNHPHQSTSNGVLGGDPKKPRYGLENIALERDLGSASTPLETTSFIKGVPGREVWEFYLETRDNIKKWRSRYLELPGTQAHAPEMDKKLNDAIHAIKNLVFKRIWQLENIAYEGSTVLNEDTVLSIFEMVDPEWISSFADSGNIRNILESSTQHTEYQSLIRCWSNIALDFLVNSLNLGITSEQSIRFFLKKTNGTFISDFIIDHFDPTDLQFRMFIFDLKLSLNEAQFFKKVSDISKFLDHEGWEKIEFRFLEMQINSDLKTIEENHLNDDVKYLLETARKFAQRISPERESPESQAVLKELLEFIASDLKAFGDGKPDEKAPILKLFYDTLRIIVRYQSRNTSIEFLAEYQKTDSFQQVRLFEEKIGLHYSYTYATYSRISEALKHVKKDILSRLEFNKEIAILKQTNRFIICNPVDSNENRQISNFVIVKNQEESPLEAENLNDKNIPLTNLPRYLHSGAPKITNSDKKLIDQIERYVLQKNVAGGSGSVTVVKNLMKNKLGFNEDCLSQMIQCNSHLFDFQ